MNLSVWQREECSITNGCFNLNTKNTFEIEFRHIILKSHYLKFKKTLFPTPPPPAAAAGTAVKLFLAAIQRGEGSHEGTR